MCIIFACQNLVDVSDPERYTHVLQLGREESINGISALSYVCKFIFLFGNSRQKKRDCDPNNGSGLPQNQTRYHRRVV